MALLLEAARKLSWYRPRNAPGRPAHGGIAPAPPVRANAGHRRLRADRQSSGTASKGFRHARACQRPGGNRQAAAAAGATLVAFETLLAEADYVCLLCPLTPATEHLMGMPEFRLMKPSAVLINTGRGKLVVEADLVQALTAGIIRYAALDVFDGIEVFAREVFLLLIRSLRCPM